MKDTILYILGVILIAVVLTSCGGGSGGTPEKEEIIVSIKEPTSFSVSNITTTGFALKWGSVATATKYFVDISRNQDFTNLVSAYSNKNVGDVTTLDVTDVEAGIIFYCRVRAANGRETSKNSGVITAATLGIIDSFPGRP